ncbi:hypothetical protein Hdeb2414_s0102g00794051 [Helianthus debilis subsp. tardiflorus]
MAVRSGIEFIRVLLSPEVLHPKYIRRTLNWRLKSSVSNQIMRTTMMKRRTS